LAVTIKDIALAAGVSIPAVSKVLHDSSSSIRVSKERADIIRRIASEAGYVPNANARNLRSSKTQTIGLYFDDLAGIAAGPLYTTYLLDGVCRVLFPRHYRVALVAELEAGNALQSLADGRLDGLIWCRMVRDRRTLKLLNESRIPVVALTVPQDHLQTAPGNVHFVRCDNRGGMQAAVDHLWDLGHRNLLFLCEAREQTASDCADRLDGFKLALKTHGVDVAEGDVQAWSWDLDEFHDWWRLKPKQTAVICWSERCAGRLLSQCTEHSIGIPSELSVVGFDSTHFCDATKPPLTAVKQPIIEMASYAAGVLLDLVDGKSVDSCHPVFDCPLDVRESTSAPQTV
jgi:LacI family transcriptional regulator